MSSDIDTAHGDIYGIGQWGSGLVTILENGHIGLCHPFDPDSTPTDLRHIVENLQQRGITTPVLLRVTDFLKYRIDEINQQFSLAIKELGSVHKSITVHRCSGKASLATFFSVPRDIVSLA